MKLISFVVPSYNVSKYLPKCIESLLIGGTEVEIIIVDDGSKDDTGIIADDYQKKYPKIVKVIHQENGGHGEAINVGLKVAKGKYFKVVDADDWIDEKAYTTLLNNIKNVDADLIVTNYVYSYDKKKPQVINFKNVFKNNETIFWNDIKKFRTTQYLSLHSMMYKKSILDKTKIELPKHISYEDNLFIYLPLIHTKTVYYLNVNFYCYYIGREGQSVSEENLIRKSDDQVLVSKLVCNAYDLDIIKSNKKLYYTMLRACILMMTLGTVFSRLNYNDKGEQAYKELWKDVKKNNPKLYKKLKWKYMCAGVSIPGRLGRFIGIKGYRLAHKLVGFN